LKDSFQERLDMVAIVQNGVRLSCPHLPRQPRGFKVGRVRSSQLHCHTRINGPGRRSTDEDSGQRRPSVTPQQHLQERGERGPAQVTIDDTLHKTLLSGARDAGGGAMDATGGGANIASDKPQPIEAWISRAHGVLMAWFMAEISSTHRRRSRCSSVMISWCGQWK